jgi:hypothetical protein
MWSGTRRWRLGVDEVAMEDWIGQELLCVLLSWSSSSANSKLARDRLWLEHGRGWTVRFWALVCDRVCCSAGATTLVISERGLSVLCCDCVKLRLESADFSSLLLLLFFVFSRRAPIEKVCVRGEEAGLMPRIAWRARQLERERNPPGLNGRGVAVEVRWGTSQEIAEGNSIALI